MTLSERAYRRLLHVFPRSFLAQYEDEMVRLFLDQLRDARGSGRAGRETALWLRSVGDIVSSAPSERLRTEERIVAKPIDPGSVSLTVPTGTTSSQRLGYAIASLPFVLLATITILAAGFMEPVFLNPPEVLGLPMGILMVFVAAVWASLAFVVVRAVRSGVGVAIALLVFTVPAIIAILLIPGTIVAILNTNV
jgi:hypothetical protein